MITSRVHIQKCEIVDPLYYLYPTIPRVNKNAKEVEKFAGHYAVRRSFSF